MASITAWQRAYRWHLSYEREQRDFGTSPIFDRFLRSPRANLPGENDVGMSCRRHNRDLEKLRGALTPISCARLAARSPRQRMQVCR